MGNSVIFSPAAAQRITNATKAVESERGDLSGRAPITLPESKQFWAKLTGEDGSNPGRYSFSKKFPSGFTFIASAPTFDISDYTAVEINGVSGLTDNYALLTFVGYDSSSPKKPVYFFSADSKAVGIVVARVDSARTKPECYQGYIKSSISGPLTVSTGSTGFSASDFGADGDEITLINFQQGDAATTHALTATTQVIKLVLALDLGIVDDGGKEIYAVVAKDFKTC